MKRDAVIPPCGQYRYLLTRTWDANLQALAFIMLNPSTADALKDDATIRVCMGRAARMGCGGIVVLNLFAYRATLPHEMLAVADPVGARNDDYIVQVLRADRKPHMVIAAWGVGGNHMGRAQQVCRMCQLYGVQLHCLGTTKDGNPRHPLRISYAVQPEPWHPCMRRAA